ncbi:MAG: 50S ribosomal protein L22 [Euryarchaeota archaeon]|nr:50S ribosomal protein L22 [Euryarchaeota archaeon]
MAKLGYSLKAVNVEKTAKVMGRALQISPKDSVEICRVLRGMRLIKAKDLLEKVSKKKTPIPYKRYRSKVGHKRGVNWDAGRYPVKAAKQILEILENAESNAVYKGLDVERLYIKHISAKKTTPLPGWTPRAFGRVTPFETQRTHIEAILEEQ